MATIRRDLTRREPSLDFARDREPVERLGRTIERGASGEAWCDAEGRIVSDEIVQVVADSNKPLVVPEENEH